MSPPAARHRQETVLPHCRHGTSLLDRRLPWTAGPLVCGLWQWLGAPLACKERLIGGRIVGIARVHGSWLGLLLFAPYLLPPYPPSPSYPTLPVIPALSVIPAKAGTQRIGSPGFPPSRTAVRNNFPETTQGVEAYAFFQRLAKRDLKSKRNFLFRSG